MSEQNELVAGPELDLAVAEALGTPGVLGPLDRVYDATEVVYVDNWLFQPSVDLNHAFRAAEKVGLFESLGPGGHRLYRFRNRWVMEADLYVVTEATPALAICAAILKLKGYEFMNGDLNKLGGLGGKMR